MHVLQITIILPIIALLLYVHVTVFRSVYTTFHVVMLFLMGKSVSLYTTPTIVVVC